jgi:Uma2 family endonuclease
MISTTWPSFWRRKFFNGLLDFGDRAHVPNMPHPTQRRNGCFLHAQSACRSGKDRVCTGMTWADICEDKALAALPYRIESDRWGNIVMSPPPRSRHAEYQGRIAFLLQERLTAGRSIPECPVQTAEGVKASDVAWVSHERRASRPNDPVYLIAPEICVEVVSPSNLEAELNERKRLFFEKGALEFWLCNLDGNVSFFDPAGPMPQSRLCPDFPPRVLLD